MMKMPKLSIGFSKAAVRPGISWSLVLVQCGIAVMWALGTWPAAADAFAGLSPFTMGTLIYWFKSRDEEKAAG